MSRRAFALGSLLLAGAALLGCFRTARELQVVEANVGLGDAALARFDCTACHAADAAASARIAPEKAPSLEHIGARRSPESLRRLLVDPRGSRAMPDVLHALAPSERERAVDELVHFLAARGGPLAIEAVELDVAELERGRQLFHSVGCVACHEAQETIDELDTPLWRFAREGALAPQVEDELGLGDANASVDALARYLVDPLAVRPHGRMPSLRLSDGEARAIASYLLRARCGEIEERAGWRYEYFELETSEPDFDELVATRTGVVATLDELPEHRDDHFAFRFTALVDVAKSGMHGLSISSDDGSWLYVDGELAIDHGGDHSQSEKSRERWLEAGRHLVEVRMYENAGQEALEVRVRPPGGEKASFEADSVVHWRALLAAPEERAFELDDAKVARGAKRFVELGCGACHEEDGPAVAIDAPPLAELGRALDRGCLAKSPSSAPRFELDESTRASLRLALADVSRLAKPLTPADELNTTIARMRCANCHTVNNGRGGPTEEKRAYFRATVEVDLGNEGRMPPPLHRIGAKLYAGATRETLLEGKVERPYLATRMPQFGEANVGRVPELVESVYGSASDSIAPPFSAESAEFGRQLAAETGLGCVMCHRFNGIESLGIPAVDLAHVSKRVKPAWFKQLLSDPKSLGMNSRMPVFWDASGVSAARDILGGDPARQIDALWSYVSLGSAMPAPDGLVVPDSEYELVPKDEPILVSTFFEGASARTMLVGTKELVHYAFDIENSRLVCAWRGRFFNAKGTWHARAGKLEKPPSDDVLWFPKLASVAILPSADAPWPTAFGRNAAYRADVVGISSNGLPGFDYRVGELSISETTCACTPERQRGMGATLLRLFTVESMSEPAGVFVLFAEGERIEKRDDGWWSIDDRMRVKWSLPGLPFKVDPELVLVRTERGAELRAPVRFRFSQGRWIGHETAMVAW